MSEIEVVEFAPEEVVDPIEVICTGESQSLSGRSVLTWAIGRHTEDGTLHLAITGNSGGGMWCRDWASASEIQSIAIGAEGLTAKSFHALHPGKSVNTGGFVLAVLKDLGLIRPNSQNGRVHEHTPTTTLQQLVMARIAQSLEQEAKPGRRKFKEG
jgi:hypothetical protein